MRRIPVAVMLLVLSGLLCACAPGSKQAYSTQTEGLNATGMMHWCVESAQERTQANGVTQTVYRTQMRSFDCGSGATREVALPEDAYIELFAPTDVPGCIVVYGSDGADGELFLLGADGSVRQLTAPPEFAPDALYGWYGGALYYGCRSDEYWTEEPDFIDLMRFDAATGEQRGCGEGLTEVFGVADDGRAIALVPRDAGYETVYRYRDSDGVDQETRRRLEAWTLGIMAPDGVWTPALRIGEDSEIREILGALWQGRDALLLAVRTGKSDDCALWRCVPSTGAVEPAQDCEGRALNLYVPYSILGGSMQLSEDRKMIFYPISEFIDGVGMCESLMAQSLETGARYRVYTDGRSAEADGAARERSRYICEYRERPFK